MAFKLTKDDLFVSNYQSLKVDKTLDHIAYNDYKHCYYNKNTGEKYISVTTLIHTYVADFDKDGWSKYKAIERIVQSKLPKDDDEGRKVLFNQYKKQAGGYANVVSYFENTAVAGNNALHEKYIGIQNKILDEWKVKNTNSLVKGTTYHKSKEDYYLERAEAYYESSLYNVCTDNNMANSYSHAIYPELLIYSDKYKIAGQADLIIRSDNDITVRDYKTNKKLDMTNFFQKMLYPLNDIEACNFNEYQLQLSLYAYILSMNYGVNVKAIYIDHHTDDGDFVYPCKYMFDHVETMLEDWKMKYERVKNSVNISVE